MKTPNPRRTRVGDQDNRRLYRTDDGFVASEFEGEMEHFIHTKGWKAHEEEQARAWLENGK